MNNLTVRPATEADFDQIFQLYYDFHEFHADRLPVFLRHMEKPDDWNNAALVDTLRKIITGPDSALLVADAGETLEGLVEVYLRRVDKNNRLVVEPAIGYVQSLVVRQSSRWKGLGRKLMQAAEA